MCRQGAAALVPSPLPIQPYAPFLAELLGTMLLVILGDGVVANVVLNKTKGQNAGWIVITAGWGFGVAVAVYAVATFSGAHLNPAVTIGPASIDKLGRADRLRDQPGARPRSPDRARAPADRGQGEFGLGLCVDPGGRTDHRRVDRGLPLQGVVAGMKHILALDQGTTSSRAIVFDHSGSVVASAQKEFRQVFPEPGWVEHDATEIWATQLHTATEALGKAGLTASHMAGIGITNQRETTVGWDRDTGEPVHHAIVWQDRRTAAACDRLKARGLAPMIKRKTGLVVDAYFSGTKLEWLLRSVPGARAKAKAGKLAFGTVDSWLVWNLTGGRVHVTDPSNASRTMLFNLRTGDWDDELLKLFGVPRSVLPHVGSSSEVYGETTLFGGRVPIAGIAGDQQAALFGQSCTQPGMVKNTY